ncbi:MAG: DEAD/DEAH box helicase family protein [Candidatus Muirbacterium halophilum]|nr:DEAD/DEAH box helicase family protein [Candidatus Muirbacterium halophilum]
MSLKRDLAKYKPRKEQKDVLDFISNTMVDKPTNKYFLLNLPTGIGKSYLAIMISNWYKQNINKSAKVDIITGTKILQDQYSQSFESINDLKGKENYTCKTYACSCAQGSEFNKLNKTSCDDCPHSIARDNYISGGISLTNFYLYILNSIYNKQMLDRRDARLLIVDEAHELDNVMSDFISIKITDFLIKKFKFQNETKIIKELKTVKTIFDYVEFVKYFNREILDNLNSIERGMSVGRNAIQDKRELKINKLTGKGKNTDLKLMQITSDLKQWQLKIEVFLKEYEQNKDNWVLEVNYNEKTKQRELSLEPIWAYDYLEKYIYGRYDMVIMMSGTILDKNLFCQLNGLDVNKTVYYSIDSPFSIKNRPIFYLPVGKMSYNSKIETFKKYIPYIQKLLNKYKNKKGIIHTNSFELSMWIEDSIKDHRLVFHDSSNKDEVLKMHKESSESTVLVSPSMDIGVSFDDDYARFQIIAKIPYPSLASQKNKLRMKNNPEWYSWKTCCSLIQACGRIIRSDMDYGDTIIIDESFSDVMRYSSKYLPIWLQDSIKVFNKK